MPLDSYSVIRLAVSLGVLCSHCLLVDEGLFFFINLFFIYLFLAALGLHCCEQAFSSCGELGLLFIAVRGLLIAVASLVACRAWALGTRASVAVTRGLSSCGSRALERRLSSCGAQA